MPIPRARFATEGLAAGLIGYAAVALFFGLVDLVSGRSIFHTAALLGQPLVAAGAETNAGAVTPAAVFAYNGLHLLVFLAIGFAAAFLVFEVELHPVFWYVAFLALLGGLFLSVFLITVLASGRSIVLPVWSIIAANVLAAVAMGTYLARRHPRLWAEIREGGDPEVEV